MRGHPVLRLTLRASVIEKRCKGSVFCGDRQIILTKSDKFPQNGELSLQKYQQPRLIADIL
jgi:hypothetical protein